MFSIICVIDSNDGIMPITQNDKAIELMNDKIVIISYEMIHHIGDINRLKPFKVCIVGTDETYCDKDVAHFKTINGCINFLSNNLSMYEWWIICDDSLMNHLIWNGAICRVVIIKHILEVYNTTKKYNFKLLQEQSCQFSEVCKNTNNNITYHEYSRSNHEELALLKSMSDIVNQGFYRPNRTGVATYSTFGKSFEYIMHERIDPISKKAFYQFPLLTTKKMFLRGVFAELKWFLSGQTDSKILESQNVNIWKGNSSRDYLDSYGFMNYETGKCGPIYGHQWRSWNAKYDQSKNTHIGEGIDQVMNCIDSLKNDPFSRRHIISGWNVEQLSEMALPPCHVIYQFYVHEKNNQRYLSLSMYQRSGDTFLGIPFNICSTALFLALMAHHIGYKPYKVIHTIGDMHIYENHVDAITKQVIRQPSMFPYIHISCDNKENIEEYEFNDLLLDGYISHSMIKADMVA